MTSPGGTTRSVGGEPTQPVRVGAWFYWTLVAVLFLSFVLHELAHWSVGEWLGYDMRMSLNHAAPRGGVFDSPRDAFLVTCAGPAFTVLQALVALLLIRRSGWLLAYPVLFAGFFMRFAALVVSVANPNDEARMSVHLGWNMWVLPALVVASLLALTFAGSRRLRLGWKTNLASYLISSAVFALIVFADARLTQP
jgi:hypothetical protein